MSKATPEWEARSVQIMGHTQLSNLADEITFQLTHEDMIEFIMELDAGVADVTFTQQLINRLNQTLEAEDQVETDNSIEIAAAVTKMMVAMHELDQAINGN